MMGAVSDISRRTILGGGALLAIGAGCAQAVAASPAAVEEILPLWPGKPPGDQGRVIERKVEERSHDPAHHDRWLTGIRGRSWSCSLHVFDEGGHGFGARLPRAVPASAWPGLFASFAARKGVFA
jgi:hypothetical protein